MMAVAYEWHNYGKSTIGNRSDIERVPVDNLRAFYKKFYQPDNAVLVVAGKFDEKKALEYIDKYFGSLPKPDRKLPRDLHRGAGPGRRAVRHAAAGRRRRPRRPALPRPRRLASRVPRGRGPGRDPRLRALGPALQGPGRDQEGLERLGLGPGATTTRARSRSWPRSTPRTWRRSRRSATRCSRSSRRWRDRASPRRRSSAPASRSSRIASSPPHDPNRIADRAERVGRAGRLAALLPQPRPAREGHARAGQGGRREVPDRQQPHGRLLRPDRPSPSGPRSPRRPTSPSSSRDYKGRKVESRGRDRSTSRRGHRGPGPAARADRRRQARLPAQEDAGRVRPAAADPPLRQRREPQGIRSRPPASSPS